MKVFMISILVLFSTVLLSQNNDRENRISKVSENFDNSEIIIEGKVINKEVFYIKQTQIPTGKYTSDGLEKTETLYELQNNTVFGYEDDIVVLTKVTVEALENFKGGRQRIFEVWISGGFINLNGEEAYQLSSADAHPLIDNDDVFIMGLSKNKAKSTKTKNHFDVLRSYENGYHFSMAKLTQIPSSETLIRFIEENKLEEARLKAYYRENKNELLTTHDLELNYLEACALLEEKIIKKVEDIEILKTKLRGNHE